MKCIPAGLGGCSGTRSCCAGLVCQSGTCTTANQPPTSPQPPQITAVGGLPLRPTGKATCILNCPPQPLPPDPQGDPVSMQYAWGSRTAGGQYSYGATRVMMQGVPDHDCASMNCDDFVRLRIRACDNKNACSDWAESNELQVVPFPPPLQSGICSSESFNPVYELAAIAAVGTAMLIAVAYMLGEFFQNPRFLTWAKTEAAQIFVSMAVVAFLLFVLLTICNMPVGEVRGMFGDAGAPLVYKRPGYDGSGLDIYSGAILYLQHLSRAALANMEQIRYTLAAHEVRTTFTTFQCDNICLFSMSSTNVAVYGGETLNLAIANNLLSVATISYLSVLFQYFTLLYIKYGLFAEFLPIAIIIRSLPFMRQFGGALIAIFAALYIMYPLMIVMDAYIAPGMAKFAGGAAVDARGSIGHCASASYVYGNLVDGQMVSPISCSDAKKEWEIQDVGTFKKDMEELSPTKIARLSQFNILIFLTAVFLPAVNFVVIAALARDLSRLLGEEADISRLGQMV